MIKRSACWIPRRPKAGSIRRGILRKARHLYTTLIPVLTKAIQEQNEAIEKQKKMIVTLQKEVEMLKKKNS